MNNLEIGTVVISKAGRDCGELYMVCASDGEKLTLVNGQEKKFEKPKQKNFKHVIVTGQKLDTIAKKISENKKIFDSEVYSALKKFAENLDKNI